jgi:hypothetical protein
MGYKGKRKSLFTNHLEEKAGYRFRCGFIEIAGRLVREKESGFQKQGTGNGYPLLLSPREFRRTVIHPFVHFHSGQEKSRSLETFIPGKAGNQARHGHILQSTELGKKVVKLEHKTQFPVANAREFCRRGPKQVPPLQRQGAGIRAVQSSEKIQ